MKKKKRFRFKWMCTLSVVFMSLGACAQTETADASVFATHCDCLKSEYQLKQNILNNSSIIEGVINSDSSSIQTFRHIMKELHKTEIRCKELRRPESESCLYEQKLEELAPDFELVIRVIEMITPQHHEINENESK